MLGRNAAITAGQLGSQQFAALADTHTHIYRVASIELDLLVVDTVRLERVSSAGFLGKSISK